ncbi:MAG: GNAT family N-acetyltransferase [Defluviitaleaceae bacterium]|nr:GNAT family N-acetyltransferase [Defluviitaleaceae bacterium]
MATVYHKIIQYIDVHIKEEITIAEIADMAGYSAHHIYKIFKVYSPYPIMEYIRRKKLYSAASEMYTGRKLYDIALDYGYETPAGFYKAFKSTFGCSPREYRNNIRKDGTDMCIDSVKSIEELDAVLAFYKVLYPDHPISAIADDSGEKFSRQWWYNAFEANAELFLFAKDGDKICAFTLGFADAGNHVTVHEGVLEAYRNTGVLEALFVELEKRVKKLGYVGIGLGIGEGEEAFYAKLGYIGKTLIQSEKYSVDELKAFNEEHNNYEIAGTNVYEGYVNQLWLNASLLDTGLKRRYEVEVGDCWVQVIVCKSFI